MSLDELRADAVRLRGFNRSVETMATKLIAKIDELLEPPVVDPPVEPPPVEPPEPPVVIGPATWAENFAGYTSESWRAIDSVVPRNPYNLVSPDGHEIVSAGGPNGGRFLRLHFAGSDSPSCANNSVGFQMENGPEPFQFPARFGDATEFWVEFSVRYAPNWRTAPPGHARYEGDSTEDWGCTNQPDHKLFRLYVVDDELGNKSMFEIKDGTFGRNWVVAAPRKGDGTLNPFPASLDCRPYWDGTWHRVRIHIRRSTERGKKDGYFKATVDGVLLNPDALLPIDNLDLWWTRATHMQFGLNRNNGREVSTFFDFADCSVSREDPGW